MTNAWDDVCGDCAAHCTWLEGVANVECWVARSTRPCVHATLSMAALQVHTRSGLGSASAVATKSVGASTGGRDTHSATLDRGSSKTKVWGQHVPAHAHRVSILFSMPLIFRLYRPFPTTCSVSLNGLFLSMMRPVESCGSC